MPKTDAEKQRDRRERMRGAGYVLRQVWVHPKDWPLVRRYIDRVNKRRAAQTTLPARQDNRATANGRAANE